MSDDRNQPEAADPEWFRAPTRRERWIAAGLFIGFGVFFVVWFFVIAGWWFRWVILVLGAYSILEGIRHLRGVRHQVPHGDEGAK